MRLCSGCRGTRDNGPRRCGSHGCAVLAQLGNRDPEMGYLKVCRVEVLVNRPADKTRCLGSWKLAIQDGFSDLGC